MRHLITTPLAPRPKRHRDHTIIPPSGPLPLLPISDDDSPLSHGSRVPLLQTPLQVQTLICTRISYCSKSPNHIMMMMMPNPTPRIRSFPLLFLHLQLPWIRI
ncbi:hypothetical protein BST61_g6253 [Cercospora zeina]